MFIQCILIEKGVWWMIVYQQEGFVKMFQIVLGFLFEGMKLWQGDGCMLEGIYCIDWLNL